MDEAWEERGMMVLLEKHVHLQNDGGASFVSKDSTRYSGVAYKQIRMISEQRRGQRRLELDAPSLGETKS